MAAIEDNGQRPPVGADPRVLAPHAARDAGAAQALGSVMAAALLLPGVSGPAGAQGKPDSASVGLRVLSYEDSQPGLKRISVISPSFQVVAPLDDDWWIDGTLVHDSLSGASPRYHTSISGASNMTDKRTAGDIKVTRYFRNLSVAGSLSNSTERDYKSTAGSLDLRWSSDDQNTSINLGIGAAEDRINPVNNVVQDEARSTQQVSLGITSVASRADVLQATLSYSDGRGYYSDPYKVLDVRPRERRQSVLLLRWNHHFEEGGSTLRSSYRAYMDSFGIQAHTVGAEWVVAIGRDWKVVPNLRLYSQTAADFYSEARYDPVRGEPFPLGYDPASPPRFITQDQRLSSYGAVTLGLAVIYNLDRDWTIDGKYEVYEQRSNWSWTGDGSVGLAPFSARSLQIGLTRRF